MKFLDFLTLLDGEPATLAVMSTFDFNADFFERRLLGCPALSKARRILVCIDASRWATHLRQDMPARFINRRYLLVPVRPPNNGVFHPKLNVLLTELGGQIQCGSNNLTRAGCASNLELLNSIRVDREADPVESVRLVQEALSFFKRACGDAQDESGKIGHKWLEEAMEARQWLTQPLPPQNTRKIRLLHTYEGKLWDRLSAILEAASPSRLLVISPFYDPDGEMFKRVHRHWPKCRVEVVVQQQVTNLPIQTLKKLGKAISLFELCSERKLHAKLVAWEGKGGSGCFVGSANFTTAAFDGRNVETCLAITNTADLVDSLFDKEFRRRAITLDAFTPGAEQEPTSEEILPPPLQLDSAVLLGDGKLRVHFMSQLSVQPSRLRIGLRNPGQRGCHAFTDLTKNNGTEIVSFKPAALENGQGGVLASLVAVFPDREEQSTPIWVIQEQRLTRELGASGSHSNRQKIKETGEGLIEWVEEIRSRDGLAEAARHLRQMQIDDFKVGTGSAVIRKPRLRIHCPFRPDVAPDWLITGLNDIEDFATAIQEFVAWHQQYRLLKHTRLPNVYGMDHFLDIFVTMVRLLYVYYVQSLRFETRRDESDAQKTGYYKEKAKTKDNKLVAPGQLIDHVRTFIEMATGGVDDYCQGYLLGVAETLADPNRLRQACTASNFAGEIKAAVLIVQLVRFTSISPPQKRPSDELPILSKKVKDTFAAVGLPEPSHEEVLKALEQYRMFSDKELAGFRLELEGK